MRSAGGNRLRLRSNVFRRRGPDRSWLLRAAFKGTEEVIKRTDETLIPVYRLRTDGRIALPRGDAKGYRCQSERASRFLAAKALLLRWKTSGRSVTSGRTPAVFMMFGVYEEEAQ